MIKIFFKIFLTYLLFFTLTFFSIIFFDTSSVSTWDVYLFMFVLAIFFAIIFSLFDFIKYLKKQKNKKKSIHDAIPNIETEYLSDNGSAGIFIFDIIMYIYGIFRRKKKK